MNDVPTGKQPSQWKRHFPTFINLQNRIMNSTFMNKSPISVAKETATSGLPDSIKLATQDFIKRTGWRTASATKLAKSMLTYFSKELELGADAETLAARWNDTLPLPSFQRLREPSLVSIHSLPTVVAETITEVVRKARLWRSEQIDIARELIDHFQVGIDDGIAPERLISDFGNPVTAARLIRRAKLRNRRLSWQIFHRARQVLAIAFVVMIFCAVWLLTRFQLSHPRVVRDYIGELDARSTLVAESNRAWPLYAEAMTQLNWNETARGRFPSALTSEGIPRPEWADLMRPIDVQRSDTGQILQMRLIPRNEAEMPPPSAGFQREYEIDMDQFWKALTELSHSPNWPALVEYVQMNQPSLELILQGSMKPDFGFVFRDPRNAAWLNSTHEGTYESLEKSTRSILMGVLLPHIQQMRRLEPLLRIGAERARLASDHERVVKILMACLNISAQIYHADRFVISQLVSFPFADRCWMVTRQILDEQPDFFTDADLRNLAHGIAAYRSKVDLELRTNSKDFCDDLLQRLYSDNGNSDGHLTPEGWRLIQKPFWNGVSADHETSVQFQVEGALASAMVATRAELKQVLDHYCELKAEEEGKPAWEQQLEGRSAGTEYISDLLSTTTGQIKYRPLKFLTPAEGISSASISLAGDYAKMRCDATTVALALTLFHRRNNAWPTHLDELRPALLPTVPLDQFDGKPMKYRLINGWPVVYSVGRNKVDDGGQSVSEDSPGNECREGDWHLWPIRPGDRN